MVEGCCGDVNQLAHENAMRRVVLEGAKPITTLSVMLEWQRHWALRDTYDAVMDIAKTHCGAYGVGMEYAYMMVHSYVETVGRDHPSPEWGARGWRLHRTSVRGEALAQH